ncbi:MAG: SLC45 family MFS transporter [Clostridiales bacterium]|nr:SLC45 family MFS transporter [Clostridiales bacterium]
MKLNVRRTALVGMAFLAINAFWGLYDFAVPLILKNTYALGETATGAVMAMDNVAALVLLPLFGALSDRRGRRMPFILWGSMAASALMVLLPVLVRQGMMAQVKGEGLAAFLLLLGLLLIAMGTFRSPTVALMPDVTPKFLRSKANAVINLMGAIGSALSLVLTKVLVVKTVDAAGASVSDYTWLFVSVAALMTVCAWVVKLTIPEERLKAEADAINAHLEQPEQQDAAKTQARRLTKAEMRSLVLILLSVALWFMAYNAVTTAFSRYALDVWKVENEGDAATCLLVATVAAIAAYWPVGIVSSHIGRKKTILIGVAMLMICFALGCFERELNLVSYVMFLMVGVGWAAIGVNSYPMVVELASGSDVGKYTGYYYTFSMAAQVLTPVLSGALLEHVGYWTLFPYALVMASCAFGTMLFVRHGDSRPAAKNGLEALDVED